MWVAMSSLSFPWGCFPFGMRVPVSWASGRHQRRRAPAAIHQALELLDRPRLDLAHALAADAELARQVFKRQRLLGKPARRKDRALALLQLLHRLFQLKP